MSEFLEPIVLEDPRAASRVEILPGRGALVSRFSVGDDEVLYLDEKTLADPAKSVRGGVPILFPIAGRLAGDRYVVDGATHEMKQHGFARTLPWDVSGKGFSRAALTLRATPATKERYPFDFRVDLGISLSGRTLRMEMQVENRGAGPMPFQAGFHPYFQVPDSRKAEANVETDATRVWDNVEEKAKPFEGFDLTWYEVDFHLLDHKESWIRLARPAPLSGIRIDASSDFGTWVVWTVRGKDYVCVEPWTAPAGAMNTGEGLLVVPPGGSRSMRIAITAEAGPEE